MHIINKDHVNTIIIKHNDYVRHVTSYIIENIHCRLGYYHGYSKMSCFLFPFSQLTGIKGARQRMPNLFFLGNVKES